MGLWNVSATYRYILCDIWGVIHDGDAVIPTAINALIGIRRRGLPVILITNAPRTAQSVEADLLRMGCDKNAWDAIVTSGDLARERIAGSRGKIFHIGPNRHRSLYDDLPVDLVEQSEATLAVCTGLFDEVADHPNDYLHSLEGLQLRNIPLICANPDVSVMQGGRSVWCAGAVAGIYASRGGQVEMTGKPSPSIYERALMVARELTGDPVTLGDGLAIGDGVHTDIIGAASNGLDAVFIAGGLHSQECLRDGRIDDNKLSAFLASHGVAPLAVFERLQ